MDDARHCAGGHATLGRVRLTLLLHDRGRLTPVTVTCPRGTTWPDLLRRLELDPDAAYAAALAPGSPPVALGPGAMVGEPPLLAGTLIRRPAPDRRVTHAAVDILVTGGPDVGQLRTLSAGADVTVGRSDSADWTIRDPGLSRRHVLVRYERTGVSVEDLGSTNGTALAGGPLVGRARWLEGQDLRCGSTVLELRTVRDVPAPLRPDGEGHLRLHPEAAAIAEVRPESVELPLPPTPDPPPAPPVVAWLLPMVVSALLAAALRMPLFLLFGLMAPALSLGGYLGERRSRRLRHRRELGAHAATLAERTAAAEQAVAREVAVREARAPGVAWWVRQLHRGPTTAVWTRTGPGPWRAGAASQPLQVRTGGTTCTGVVPVELLLDGGVGVHGREDVVRGWARALLVQVLAACPPTDLRVELETPAASRHRHWDWLAWVPHTQSTRATHQLRLVDTLDGAPVPQADEQPGDARVVLAQSAQGLGPVRTVIRLESATSAVLETTDGPLRFTPDLCRADLAAAVCRALAPLRTEDGDGGDGLPDQVCLTELVTVPPTPEELASRWEHTGGSMRITLGRGESGPAVVDLASDGPHALIGGTTGAGKSELLRTIVAALALANRPDELSLLLVDYKGGSAFTDAARLPHTVGLITDLDEQLAERALSSLTAELKRRERQLAEVGATDLAGYRSSSSDPLARLVILVDEFRALADELPGFLDGLVRLAAQGRSLGIHLVLATQRPGGVVRADVRANLNLRISLRMRETTDSLDVIDSPAAAQLPAHVPGRALIRIGSAPPTLVQVARPIRPGRAEPGVDVRTCGSLWDLHPGPGEGDAGEAGPLFPELVDLTSRAASLAGVAPAPVPWLPPLPDVVPARTLSSSSRPGETAYALHDLPHQQRQHPLVWRPDQDGGLALVGGPRSGRTTALRTLVAGLVTATPPTELHLYVFDTDGGLTPLTGLPHTATVVGTDDVARARRVVDHLAGELEARRRTGGTVQAPRPATSPLVLVVVDSWPRFTELLGEPATTGTVDRLTRLLRDGAAHGVVPLVSGDRSLLTSRVAAALPQRWFLRTHDPADLLLAGLTRAQVPSRMPPGRMVRVSDGAVAHAAVLGEDADPAAQLDALRTVVTDAAARAATLTADGLPPRLRALPTRLSLADLPETVADSPDLVALGVGGDLARPVGLRVDPEAGSTALVLGPPGSGRSTTLRTVAAGARCRGWTVVRVPGAGLPGELVARPRSRTVVLVDDLTELSDADEAVLTDWVSSAATHGGAIVLAAEPEALTHAYTALARALRRCRHGVVLQPRHPGDGAALGVSTLPDLPVAGRGVLVEAGRCTPVQVALPE